MIVVVPNELSDAIDKKITLALSGRSCSEKDREIIRNQLIGYYNEHGIIPDFDLSRQPRKEARTSEDG